MITNENKGHSRFELIAALVTASGKFLLMDLLDQRLLFITIALSFWTIYLAKVYRKNPKAFKDWGFRIDNLRSTIKQVLPFGLIAIILSFLVGDYLGNINLSWHILPILFIYPIWGIIQQFLILGLVTKNLQESTLLKNKTGLIVFLSAVIFASIHYPHYWLILGTFVLASIYSFAYLREKNLFVLGILHGWLGAVFFYTVVGRDPFTEIFGQWL